MTREEKEKLIRPWIDPEERITVNFLDAPDLNAEVTGCTDRLVDVSIETRVSHMKQHPSLPLSQVEVSEEFSHYTRDPNRPLQESRLMLVIKENCPPHHLLATMGAMAWSDGNTDNEEMPFAHNPIKREGEGAHVETIFSEHETAGPDTADHDGPWSHSGRIQREG